MRILYFASIDWTSLWQRPQQLLTRLASFDYYNIVYIQPFGLRNLQLSDIPRVINRFRSLVSGRHHSRENIEIKDLFFLPVVHSWSKLINIPSISYQLRDFRHRNTIAWVTTPAQVMPNLISSLSCRGFIYEMMDDYSKIHIQKGKEIKKIEAWLIEHANLVIATSSALYEKAKNIKEDQNIAIVANGVDYDYFEKISTLAKCDVKNTKIVGYIGAIDEWIDFKTIEYVADVRKDLMFMFVGPVQVNRFPQKENIQYVGAVEYSKVPSYCNSFDVCLIPFKTGEFADAINPIKLYEYFACGKPVVAYEMRELKQYKDALYLAKDRKDFLNMIEKALSENNWALSVNRKMIARRNDWSERVKTIDQLIKNIFFACS